MTTPLALFLQWIIKQYNLNQHALNGKVHLELRRAVWGLPQVEILANKQLQQKLAPFKYHKCLHMPGLWYHETCPILLTLVVDNFGIKFINDDNVRHLIASLKTRYKLTEDGQGTCIAVLPLSGITSTELLTSPCQDT
jgi:hypothetical protein